MAQAWCDGHRCWDQLHPRHVFIMAISNNVCSDHNLDSTKKSGQRLVGDVDTQSCLETVSRITPVPGGVGPMTVAMLMVNTWKASKRLWDESRSLALKPLKLDIKEKVPSDIEIAKAQVPKPVADLAHEIGLLPSELESYGRYKAKVELSVLERLAHRKDGKYILISG